MIWDEQILVKEKDQEITVLKGQLKEANTLSSRLQKTAQKKNNGQKKKKKQSQLKSSKKHEKNEEAKEDEEEMPTGDKKQSQNSKRKQRRRRAKQKQQQQQQQEVTDPTNAPGPKENGTAVFDRDLKTLEVLTLLMQYMGNV